MLRFAPRWVTWSTWAPLAMLLMVVPGCSKSESKKVLLGKVRGVVRLEGKPVQTGCVITFIPKSAGAEIGSGLIRDDGNYVATSGDYPGIPIGDYRIVISPPRMDPKAEEELEKKNSQAVMNALIKMDRNELEKVEYPQEAIVPKKYWTEATSGLTFTVAEGDNTADFELSSKSDKARDTPR